MRHNESLKPHGIVLKAKLGKEFIEGYSADNGVLNGIHQTWSDNKFTAAFYIKGEFKGSIQWDDDKKEVQREGDPNMIEKEDYLHLMADVGGADMPPQLDSVKELKPSKMEEVD